MDRDSPNLSFCHPGFVLAGINLFLNYRALDSLYMFLIVWYYCTLTIRESILKVNGSRIKVIYQTNGFDVSTKN